MQKVIKFSSKLLATEPAETSLSRPGLNIILSEVLKMLQSRMGGNGVASLLTASTLILRKLAVRDGRFLQETLLVWVKVLLRKPSIGPAAEKQSWGGK